MPLPAPHVTLAGNRAISRAEPRADTVQRSDTHDHSAASDASGGSIYSHPKMALVYLFFVFLPLFFVRWSWLAIAASVVAIVLFLPLHFAFYRCDPRARALLPYAVAAIGLALIPFNSGGNTFLIYAMAMIASKDPPRRAVAIAAALLVVMGLEFWWVMPHVGNAMASTSVVAVIGAMVVFGTLFERVRERRDAQLRLTQDEVRRLAALAERERIGRDLHDLLGHTLSLVALKSELAGKLVDRDPVAAKTQIGEVEQVARQALAQVREAVAGIRASGLHAELAAARLALLTADVSLDQHVAASPGNDRSDAALALVLREAVTNVLRHAQAQRVEVEVQARGGELQLSIADDGRGGIARHGNGLTGMQERLAALGGRLEIDSPAGGGTRLLARVPHVAEAAS